jgi:hypothetical protein
LEVIGEGFFGNGNPPQKIITENKIRIFVVDALPRLARPELANGSDNSPVPVFFIFDQRCLLLRLRFAIFADSIELLGGICCFASSSSED